MNKIFSANVKVHLRYAWHFCLTLFYTLVVKNCIRLTGKRDTRKLKHRISLCLIFKNEAPFLKEWIDFHRTIGIDHFYLYNNNSTDNYQEVLESYVNKGIVTLIDFPYNYAQMQAYEHCYEHFKGETNWIGFMDADEFICPRYQTDINEWLSKYDKYHSVLIYFHVFGTGGQLKHDYSKNVIEQYFSCWPTIQNCGKCFVNTRFSITNYNTVTLHHSTCTRYRLFGLPISLPPVNQFGYICPFTYVFGGVNGKLEKADICLNHYFTKAWDIYKKKMESTYVCSEENPKTNINYFYFHEDRSTARDYTIIRFAIRMRHLQNLVD